MRKIISHMWVKTVAMVLCIASVIGAGTGLVGYVVTKDLPAEQKLRNTFYNNISTNYAALILGNAAEDDGTMDFDWFEGKTSFRYAVIAAPVEQTGNLTVNGLASQIDLSDPDIYAYGSPEDLENFRYAFYGGVAEQSREYISYNYNTTSVLAASLSGAAAWESATELAYEAEPIEGFYFAWDTGIFYTKTASGLYPINHIAVASLVGENAGEVIAYYLNKDDGLYYVSERDGSRLDFEQFADWGMVKLGEYYDIEMPDEDTDSNMDVLVEVTDAASAVNHITILSSEELPTPVYAPQTGYFSNETYYHLDPMTTTAYYYVLSYVDEDYLTDDLFAQSEKLIALLQGVHQNGLLWAAAFAIVFAGSFVFLMACAGHRREDEAIHLRVWDKIPLGIYLVGAGVVEFAGMMLCLVIDRDMHAYPDLMVAAVVTMLAGMAYLVLVFLMSVAVRIKAGVFWKNTLLVICGKKLLGLLGKIKNRLRMIACAAREHTSLFRQTVVILIAVFFADLILFWIWTKMYYGYSFALGILVWLAALSVLKGGVVIWAVLQMARLQEGSRRIAEGDNSTPIDTQGMFWEFKKHAENINKIGDGIAIAVEQQMKSERFKTELITNVSHDIKTPLTSIINYVDLIKKEEITDPVLTEYVDVLDRQSARLKKLIEDLMEASKASTGNLTVHLEKCDAAVFLSQVVGEFQDRAHANDLSLIVTTPPEPVEIMADGRHLWRVFDNLLNNICKYAQPGTRVYISLEEKEGKALLTFKNISRYQLNISGEELMERFVRGDSSRNTEGSGLGLSIAQSLTTLMNGTMDLSVDGDLFKVTLSFDAV